MPGVWMATHPTGELVIDGTSLHTHAWNAPSLLSLWATFDVAGDDMPFPHVGGARPYARVPVPTEHSIRLVFAGECDPDGAPHSDPWEGLYANVAELRDAIVLPPGDERGTLDAVLTLP